MTNFCMARVEPNLDARKQLLRLRYIIVQACLKIIIAQELKSQNRSLKGRTSICYHRKSVLAPWNFALCLSSFACGKWLFGAWTADLQACWCSADSPVQNNFRTLDLRRRTKSTCTCLFRNERACRKLHKAWKAIHTATKRISYGPESIRLRYGTLQSTFWRVLDFRAVHGRGTGGRYCWA